MKLSEDVSKSDSNRNKVKGHKIVDPPIDTSPHYVFTKCQKGIMSCSLITTLNMFTSRV